MKPSVDTESRLFSLELFIAKFLRYGVFFAAALLFVGWMMQIDFRHDTFEAFSVYKNTPLKQTLSELTATNSYGLLISYLGLVVLISLPVLRVALTACAFVMERDYRLAAVAVVVLVGLLFSFVLGFKI